MLRTKLTAALAVIAVAMCAAGPPAALAQEALSTAEMEALSPKAATRKVQQDLLSVLRPIERIDSGMFRRLQSAGFITRPVGTEYEGVCRRDTVRVLYAPAQTGFDYEDTPLRPYGVEADAWFDIVHLPGDFASTGGEERLIWQRACARLGDDADWFWAKDAFHAVQGVFVLEAAREAVQSGRLKPVPCKLLQPEKTTCEKVVVELAQLAKLGSVETCPADWGALCYEFGLDGNTTMRVQARGGQNDERPSEVLSISIEQYLVVT